MRYRLSRTLALTAVAAAIATLTMQAVAEPPATDWPQFRGARRDGVSMETGLLGNWPANGPEEVWRVPIGEGYSGISVVGDRLYTMYGGEAGEGEEGDEFTAAFDANTGKEIWRTAIGKKKDTEFGNGPRATPSVHGDTVYVTGSFGDFAALSTKDGSVRWSLNLSQTFGSKQPHWGFSSSCLVDGDQVIVESGGPDGKSYAAFDRKTGEVRWTAGDGSQQPSHSSPLLVNLGGEHQYVQVVGTELRAIDAGGKKVWSHPWPEGETHSMAVFVHPDKIFASGAEGVGAQLIQIEREEGGTKVQEIWKEAFMRNHFSSSVVVGDHLYGFDNATLKCIRLSDGKLAWAKRGFGKGSLIVADDHLYVLSDRGRLLLIKASPAGYEEVGSIQALEGRCWTAPTLAGGRVYLRSHTEMVSYDVKG